MPYAAKTTQPERHREPDRGRRHEHVEHVAGAARERDGADGEAERCERFRESGASACMSAQSTASAPIRTARCRPRRGNRNQPLHARKSPGSGEPRQRCEEHRHHRVEDHRGRGADRDERPSNGSRSESASRRRAASGDAARREEEVAEEREAAGERHGTRAERERVGKRLRPVGGERRQPSCGVRRM